MAIEKQNNEVSVWRRIGFWFSSFLLVVPPFCFFFGRAMGAIGYVFYVTLVVAFPVWCLYLPFIFRIKNAAGWRSAVLLLSGAFIGPATIFILGLLTGDENFFWKFWSGDPEEGMGTGYYMVLALIAGFFISAIYVLFLKFARSRHPATKSV